jgi:hypothetical protein
MNESAKPVFDRRFLCELAELNPWGRLDVEPEDVQSWAETVWPEVRSRYTNRKKAIRSWWRRATEEELERARARRLRQADEAERLEMAKLQAAANAVRPVEPTRSFYSQVRR